jgi:hypothetical protein
MSVLIRRLSVVEVLARQRARSAAEVARHNAHIVDTLDLGPRQSRRDQVLEQFPSLTRRWAKAG